MLYINNLYQEARKSILFLFFFLVHQSSSKSVPGTENVSFPWWAEVLNFVFIIILVMTSGLAAGLTLGLLSLDKIGLEIIISGDNKELAKCARKIQPVRENGNLLLCTLLFANVALNAALSILSAHITTNLVGFLLSTFLILIFAEIIPMSVCGRYALNIGARAVPFVKVLMVVFYPICKPFAFCLDYMLGEEVGTIHSRQELMKLLEIHVQHGSLDAESGAMVGGALKFKLMEVKDAMTPSEKVFALNENEILDFKTLAKIFKSGFSRIPVFEDSIDDSTKFLFVKDLIFLDPRDATPLKNFIAGFGHAAVLVTPDTKLDEVLTQFKKGQGHMALVKQSGGLSAGSTLTGIVTLKDIMERIIGDSILDKNEMGPMDVSASRKNRQAALDYSRVTFSPALIDARLPSIEEAKTITSFMLSNPSLFNTKDKPPQKLRLSYEQAIYMVRQSSILQLKGNTDQKQLRNQNLLYRRGTQSTVLTLILEGTLTVLKGRKEVASELGPWSVLAGEAILHDEGSFSVDFTAYVSSSEARCIQISHAAYKDAMLPQQERRYMNETSSEDWFALVRRNSSRKNILTGSRRRSKRIWKSKNPEESPGATSNPVHDYAEEELKSAIEMK